MENKSLNLLKGMACLVVILLHCPLPGILGEAIVYGLRFPVPSFFMITGYFSCQKGTDWLLRRMKKTALLIVGAEAFAGVVRLLIGLADGWEGFGSWISQFEGFHRPFKVLFFGSLFNGTLWYLYAAFWTFVIMYAAKRLLKSLTFLYCLTPFLIVAQIAGRFLMQTYGDMEANSYLFGGAVLFGIPFVMAGSFIAGHEEKIARLVSEKRCVLLFFAGICLMAVEFLVWHTYMDLHGSTVVITFALFWWACSHAGQDYIPWLRILGKKYSMWMYVVHFPLVLAMNFLQETYVSEKLQQAASWLKPPAVIICSFLLACCAERIKFQMAQTHRISN